MTRQQYIQMRNDKRLDLNLIYHHFVKEGGKAPPNEFQLAVQMLPEATGQIARTLDQKFEVTLVEDLQGNFIKAL